MPTRRYRRRRQPTHARLRRPLAGAECIPRYTSNFAAASPRGLAGGAHAALPGRRPARSGAVQSAPPSATHARWQLPGLGVDRSRGRLVLPPRRLFIGKVLPVLRLRLQAHAPLTADTPLPALSAA